MREKRIQIDCLAKRMLCVTLLFVMSLAGCTIVPLNTYHPTGMDDVLSSIQEGDKKSEVEAKVERDLIGAHFLVEYFDSKKSYLVYSTRGDTLTTGMFMLIPLAIERSSDTTLICIGFEFDQHDTYLNHKVTTMADYDPDNDGNDEQCAHMLYEYAELEHYTIGRKRHENSN